MKPNLDSLSAFRHLCRQHGIAATHQRQAVYECVMESNDHPTPELLHERVRRRIPMISLATIYKCVHTFMRIGLWKEASLHHGPVRVDPNLRPHHHLVCRMCGSMTDISHSGVDLLRIFGKLPRRFRADTVVAEILGTCVDCQIRRR